MRNREFYIVKAKISKMFVTILDVICSVGVVCCLVSVAREGED